MDYHWTVSMAGHNEELLVPRIFPDIDDKYKTWNLLRIESDITEVDSAFEEVRIKINASSPESVPVFIPLGSRNYAFRQWRVFWQWI